MASPSIWASVKVSGLSLLYCLSALLTRPHPPWYRPESRSTRVTCGISSSFNRRQK
ncbi:hypothetical protein ACFPRL_05000 [Pseudoclavibacter helvolus]